jgi:nucleotide-binding universal stress UspA family protein
MGRIVVGVDGSAGSEQALRWAAREAVLRDSAVSTVMAYSYRGHAIARPWAAETEPSPEEVEERARETLAGTVTSAGPFEVDVEQRVAEGSAPNVLLGAAEGADLLVVGSRGVGGFRGLLLGSVSRQIAARSPVPAAVVPAGTSMTRRGRIVVGVDGSDESVSALRWAVDAAGRHDAALDVIHVHPDPPMVGAGIPLPPDAAAELEDRAREDGERIVRDVVGGGLPGGARVGGAVGHPARRLLEAAEAADLLVVGSRGRGGVSATLLGSTSVACVSHAPCPTVVVHHRPD